MGLLDWLTDAIGGSGSSGSPAMPGSGAMVGQVDPMGSATGQMMPMPPIAPAATREMPPMPPTEDSRVSQQPTAPPMPPVQGLDNGGRSPVQMLGQDAPPLPPGQQGVSSGPPIPMPRPRPAGADAPPQVPPGMSQPPIPGGAPGQPLDVKSAVQSYQQAGGSLTPPDQPGSPGFSLTRALGLNVSDAQRGALAAGLKSVGENSHKPGLAAFSGSLGAGMEGAKATTDKTYDNKIKYLQASVAAQKAGDDREAKKNYAAYLSGKLKNDTDKMTADAAAGGGKKGAWNKPDSQKFIDAQHALASDPEIKASQKLLEQTAKGGEPAEVAKAQAQHQALIREKEARYLAGVGLDPKKMQDLVKNPPGSQGNPHTVTSQQEFDQYVKPGDAYVNPKDGKVYIRKGGDASGGESKTAAPAAPAAPAPAARAAPTEDED